MRRVGAQAASAASDRRNRIGGLGTRSAGRAALVVALMAGALAACGNGPAPEVGPIGTVHVPIQTTIAPLDTSGPTVDPSAAGPGGDFDVSQGLKTTSCAAAGGTWSYSGTMSNPDSAERTFTVAIFLVKTSDMSTVVTKEVEATIPAGGSAPIEAKDFFTGATTGVECLTGATVKGQ